MRLPLVLAVVVAFSSVACRRRSFEGSEPRMAAAPVDESAELGRVLSAKFAPKSQRSTIEEPWAYAKVWQSVTSDETLKQTYVLLRKGEGQWEVVKEFPSPASVAELVDSQVPSLSAKGFVRRVEEGFVPEMDGVFEFLSSKYNPYRCYLAASKDWAFVRFQPYAGNPMVPPQRLRHGIMRREGDSWEIVKEGGSLQESDLVEAGVPRETAGKLASRLQEEIERGVDRCHL